MTTTAPHRRDALSPDATPLTAVERVRLDEADVQRRLHLLRPIVAGLLVVTLLALPFGIQADSMSGTFTSTLQDGIGVAAFAVAFWATRTRRVTLASAALFAGVTGVIVYLLLSDGPLQGGLDLTAIPAFALLILPIAIAGIFGGPLEAAVTTAAAAAFTLLLILLTPQLPMLARALRAPDGLAVFTVPLATQIAFGILMFGATRGFRRTQRELVSVRVAYEREKELDRLKDQFIASVNHELRTPIMALQGYLELARELGVRGELTRQEHFLQRGTEAAEHLAGLVRGVLEVRRIEADLDKLEPTRFALRPLIVSATHLLSPGEAGNQIRALHLRVPDDVQIFADQNRVRQVVLNLLSNASKYSPPGSPIEITARVRENDPPARLGWRAAPALPPMVEIAVRDYGPGIPPDQAPLVFQRFVRLERDIASPVGGTGLGLAICRAYVEAMGGQIWCDSSGIPDEGSTFTFTLPLAHPALDPPAPNRDGATDTTSAPGPTL
jgi:signal transduction histidine kinase